MDNVGSRIKSRRKERGISQRDLAIRAGWGENQTRISSYESGRTEPSYADMVKISKVLGVNAAWLAFGGNPIKLHDDGLSVELIGNAEISEDEVLPEGYVELPVFTSLEQLITLQNSTGLPQALNSKAFPQEELDRTNVKKGEGAISVVAGSTMAPLISEGSQIGVDLGKTQIQDGDMYLFQHYDLLRVGYLYRVPGGIRAKYLNEKDWPTDMFESESDKMTVVGRVFWYSVLR